VLHHPVDRLRQRAREEPDVEAPTGRDLIQLALPLSEPIEERGDEATFVQMAGHGAVAGAEPTAAAAVGEHHGPLAAGRKRHEAGTLGIARRHHHL
jgi:hypothetical protein